MTPLLKFEITVCFSCFLCQLIHGHWGGLISRNGYVWPTLFLLDVFTALKGTYRCNSFIVDSRHKFTVRKLNVIPVFVQSSELSNRT